MVTVAGTEYGTPVLVLRFDADTPAALERIQNVFREQLLALMAAPIPLTIGRGCAKQPWPRRRRDGLIR